MMPPRVRSTLYVLVLALAGCGAGDEGESGPASEGGGGGADPYAAERAACVERINNFRATLDLPPLQAWTEQGTCTDAQAKSDSQSGDAHGAFGDCSEFAQNECPGWKSIEQTIDGCLQSMWNEGPGEPYSEHGHFLNMSSTEYARVACGFYETPDGEVWAIQNFR